MTEVKVSILLPKNSKGKPRYRLLEELTLFGHTVPAGFVSDGATVPRVFWSLLPPVHEYFPSAVLHDWLLYTGYPRKEADQIFRNTMIWIGVNPWRARIMYAAVRLFAKFSNKR